MFENLKNTRIRVSLATQFPKYVFMDQHDFLSK